VNWGYISAEKLESESSKRFCCVHFTANQATSADCLQCPGHQNIPQVPGNPAEVGQNHDASKAVSATMSVLKWSGVIFRPRISKGSVQKNLLCPFHCRPRPSGVSLESLELEYIPEVSGNPAEVGQNHDARKMVLASLSVLNWSGAIFRAISSKVSVQKVFLCPFNCKLRPSEVSLAPPGIENIRQLPGKRAQVGQNYDARKAVSATLSVLKWSRAIFRPRSSKVSVQKVVLCPFHCKPRPSAVSLESPGLEYIPEVPGNPTEVGQNHDARKTLLASLSVLK